MKEARLARGWTPKAAAKATKIKEQQILQLEGEAFDKFAAPAYVRGFVRIYARTLGLDEAAVTAELERLLAAQGDDVYLTTSPVQYSAEGNSRFLSARGITYTFALVLTAALLVVAGIHIVMLARDGKTAKAQKAAAHPAAVAAAPAPDKAAPHPADEKVEKAEAVAPPAEEVKKAEAIAPPAEPVEKAVPAKPETVARAVPVSVAAVAHDLVLQADEDCWIHVQAVEADGVKDLFQGVLAEDAEKHFTAAHFRIKIAIPAALTVTYDGNTIRHNESRVPAELTLPTE